MFGYRICVVCIAPSHPILTNEIESVDFQSESVDLSKNKVFGKRKSMQANRKHQLNSHREEEFVS